MVWGIPLYRKSKWVTRAVAGAIVLTMGVGGFVHPAFAKDKFIALGTSSKSGVYYPVGSGICDMVNEGRDQHLVRCLAYPTGGSIYNLQALRSGELDVAITRADLAYLAANGEGIFKDVGPMRDLRIVASLYENPVGVIVKKDSSIATVDDLPGNRINIGNLGSGKRDFSDLLFKVMGWKKGDFTEVTELSTSKMGSAFCDGGTDVLIQVMGIPATFYDQMINECSGRFVPFSIDALNRIKNAAPFLEQNTIPGGMYYSNMDKVQTVGAKAVLVTMARVDNETVQDLSSALYGNIEKLKKEQPAMGSVTMQAMTQEGIYVPFHAGAVNYLQGNNIPYLQLESQTVTDTVTNNEKKIKWWWQ